MKKASNTKTIKKLNEHIFIQRRSAYFNYVNNLLTNIYWWTRKQPAIRYRPVIKEIRKNFKNYGRILEIGPSKKRIHQNKIRKIFYVDKNSEDNCFLNSSFIKANASNLPFKNDSFDLVFAIDVLEHIPRKLRQHVMLEMCRISRRKVIIGTPCGKKSEYWENKARKILFNKLQNRDRGQQKSLMRTNSWLIDHINYRLPREEELRSIFCEYGKNNLDGFDIQVIGNESLYVWYFGTLGYMRYSYLRFAFTALIFIIFFPILSRLEVGGVYRKLIIFEKVDNDSHRDI